MKLFEELLQRAMTAFYMPLPWADPAPGAIIGEAPDYDEALRQIWTIPFPCIRIIRESAIPPGAEGWNDCAYVHSDCVCEMDRDFRFASKETLKWPDGFVKIGYVPEDMPYCPDPAPPPGVKVTYIHLPRPYIALMEALNDRQHRFIEGERLTRQARRALGVSPEYREYIVVRKCDKVPGAHTIGELFRRHPMLHAVRAHLRHYKSGLVTQVRAHARGRGEMFQVKDYRVQA